MLFQFDWGWVAGQAFQIITSIEITSYEILQKSETAAKLHFGVNAALSIDNIFSPQSLSKNCFGGGWKDAVCFHLEIYVPWLPNSEFEGGKKKYEHLKE